MIRTHVPSAAKDSVPSDLPNLLAPHNVEEFFASSWGKSYRHIAGWPGKFAELLSWNRLNEILRQHRLEPPRLRLARGGRMLDSSAFLEYRRGKGHQSSRIPRLLPTELTEQLRRGATLVLDAVDELHEPLTELAESLERLFRVRIQINSYAGWRTSHGFDLHWDDHDVFILQVAGRKRWRVYPQARAYPLAVDVEDNKLPPLDLLWEGTLEDGDLLYIPRGWWHVALPLDEPTLHLTVGVSNPTGVDLLLWLADQLRASEIVRMDLPRFACKKERAEHTAHIRDRLLQEWGDDLLDRYFCSSDQMSMPRPRFSLPWSASHALLPPTDEARVRITAPRPLELRANPADDTVEFSGLGKRWRFARAAEVVLRPLIDGHVYSVAELCAMAAGTLDRETVRTFLGELLVEGLIAVVGPREEDHNKRAAGD